jgi:glutamyl-Q tRNA(Asp) synthetase
VAASTPASRPNYLGRFAPSPTGPLHFGSLVAAMASYADARAAQGHWLVRIEDVDTPRAPSGMAATILAQLERFGFIADGPIWRQSLRGEAYAGALEALRTSNGVYACTCTRRELAGAKLSRIGERVYPGHCRERAGLPSGARDPGSRLAWRLRVPAGPIDFVDRNFEVQSQDLASDVGDFVVRRSDGLYAYQLAVVVDDAAQRITDVVRGADLLASTARQMFLHLALGTDPPRYLHVPVAVDSRGAKLSKQTRAPALVGNPLPALLAAWDFLGQAAPARSPGTIREFWQFAIAHWEPRQIPRVPTVAAPAAFAGQPAVRGRR